MGDGEGHRLFHIGMGTKHVVYFARRDLLAAAIDDLLDAAADGEIAIGIDDTEIAGAEPRRATLGIGREGRGIGGLVVGVAARDIGAANDDFAFGAGRAESALCIERANFRTGRQADRAGLAWRRWQGIGSHLVGGFGHAIGFQHRACEDFLQARHHRRRQG